MKALVDQQTLDATMARRFDERVLALARIGIPLHAVAIIGMAPFGSSFVSPVAHLLMAVIAYGMAHRTRDGIKFIIFSHVYWTFSFATYLFAASHLQAADHGLGNADRAAMIGLAAQASLWLAFLFSPEGDPIRGVSQDRRFGRQRLMQTLTWPMLVLGLAGIVGEVAGLIPPVGGQSLVLSLYLGLGLLAAQARPFLNPLTCCALMVIAGAAVLANERSALFGAVLFLTFVALVRAPRLASLKMVLVGYLSWRMLVVFSAIALSIRWARSISVDMANLFGRAFFSNDTLWSVLNPLHVHAAELQAASETGQSGFYSEFLGSTVDIVGRLALLPQMDIVTRHFDPFEHRYADQFWPIVGSALPSVGQIKQLIFSDVVVWDLALRSRETIGRPMITAQGELFAIGGYLAVFCVVGVCFYILHHLYRHLVRRIGTRTPVILLFPQLMAGTMLSTTLLSTVAGTVREPLLMIVALGLATVVFGVVRDKGWIAARAEDAHS